MLGHLKPTFCKSSKSSKENYWEFYCSVCASLRKQHNLASSFLLNNEITLILSAFQDDFEDLKDIKTACPAKAFLAKNYAFAHPAIDVAGHLSVVLGWIKVLDWQTDSPHMAKRILLNRLHKKAQRILPTLSAEAQQTIEAYTRLTRDNIQDFAEIRAQSAALAQMLVREIGQKTEANPESIALIEAIFGKAGELIAVADHLIDLEKDQKYAQYNPIILAAETHKIPLAQAYLQLKMQYYALRHDILKLLPAMNPAFVEALKQSMYGLDKQIDKHLPACMHTAQAREMVGKMQTAQGSMAGMPLMPEASDCCNEACCGACLGACVQGCAQGCCDSMCNSCCSDGCCANEWTPSPEAQQRREERREARAQKRAEKEARKKRAKEGKETKEDKEKKKQNPDGAY